MNRKIFAIIILITFFIIFCVSCSGPKYKYPIEFNPEPVTTLYYDDFAPMGAVCKDSYLYVSGIYEEGYYHTDDPRFGLLKVIDISDMQYINEVNSVEMSYGSYSLFIKDDYMYSNCFGIGSKNAMGIDIFNIKDSINPVRRHVNYYPYIPLVFSEWGIPENFVETNSGFYWTVVDEDFNTKKILRITGESAQIEEKILDNDAYTVDLDGDGNYIYEIYWSENPDTREDIEGIYKIDVSNFEYLKTEKIFEIVPEEDEAGYLSCIEAENDYIYVGYLKQDFESNNYTGGIAIFNDLNSGKVEEVSFLDMNMPVVEIDKIGNYLLTDHGETMSIIDINKQDPKKILTFSPSPKLTGDYLLYNSYIYRNYLYMLWHYVNTQYVDFAGAIDVIKLY